MYNINSNNYSEIKYWIDTSLNKNKDLFKTSNDEPTPMGCIEEILEKVPIEFWKNKDIKILDPCCGNGNWHISIWNIMKKKFTNKDILDTFYFNDTNKDRIDNIKSIFNEDVYDLHITNKDFLEFPDTQIYDMIVANPPYAKLMDDGKRASKNHTLIRDFLRKSLKLLKEDGYLVYLIPDNWMSLADRNTIIGELTKYQFIWLNIHSAKKWFPKIGSSFTWFVLQKSKTRNPFTVEGKYNKKLFKDIVLSQERDYIPLFYNRLVQTILSKTIDSNIQKFKVETSSDLHKYTKKALIRDVKDDKYTFKLIHTPKQTVYSERPHKYQYGYKLFISTTDKYSTFVDNCGMTQSIAFIRCSSQEEANNLKLILDHDLYRFLNNICRWGNFNNIRILQRFPIPNNKNNIYESFGISEQEIICIEEFL